MDKHAEFLGSNPADPYEEQLLEMFRSCDSWNHGYLDRCGLELLCTKLHLEDARPQLIECLLTSKETVTFAEFRDALLTLLGSAMKQSDEARDPSPVREVSPKFVFGQKKYGRRSRPESTDQEGGVHDIHIDELDADAFVPSIDNVAVKVVHDDVDQEKNGTDLFDKDVLGESEPQQTDSPRSQCELELKAAWQRLGVGSDGFLDQEELAMVCRAVGMERASNEIVREVFSKLGCDAAGRISFSEFLQLLRSGYTCPSPPQTDCAALSPPSPPPTPFHPLHPTSLDVSSSGYVSADSVVELWEMTGVPDAASLLQELGLSSTQDVSLSLLSGILDEELRTLRANSVKLPSNPLVTYLSASMTLAHVQLKQSKNCLEQLTGERDKLRSDLMEANHRATLLAQEVDDSHARLERATQKQVKLLEQRHTEQVKQLTAQLVSEREQLTGTTLRLEKKLADVQEEESRLRSEVSSLQTECLNMEKENRNLIEQLALSETSRKHAEDEIQRMESLQIRLSELEGSSFQVASLVEQLAELQTENTKLRDRNDELTTQIETLSSRLSNRKQGSSMSLEGGTGGGGGVGTKRRGHSPVRGWDSVSPSPRQGKVRRCCTENDLSLDNVPMEGLAIRPLRHSESGLGVDLETLDDSLTLSNCSDNTMSFKVGSDSSKDVEVEKLQAYVSELERLVEQYRLKLAVFELGPEMCDEDSEIESNFKTFIKIPHLEEENTAPRTFIVSKDGDQLNGSTQLVDKEISCYIDMSCPKQLTEMEIQTSIQDCHEVDQLEKHCQELESKLNEVQVKILDILNEKKASDEENSKLREEMGLLRKKIDQSKSPTNFNDGIQWDCSVKVEPVISKSEVTLESTSISPSEVDINCPVSDSSSHRLASFSFTKDEVTDTDNDDRHKVFSFENLSQYSFKVTPDLGCDRDVSFNKLNERQFASTPLCLKTSSLGKVNCDLENENSMNCDDPSLVDLKSEKIECETCPDDKTVSEENVNNLLLKNKQLSDRCVELETSLDLMRIEYEKCEDYWQSKLDEERRIFDQEQKLSDSKFAELESKILEYAELYSSETDHKQIDNRLPTIEEKDSLERQFIDLEEEFEEFRKRAEAELSARDREISALKVLTPSRADPSGCEIGVQTDSLEEAKSDCIPQDKSRSASVAAESHSVRADCSCNCHKELPREVQRMREAKVKLQSEYKVLSHRKEQLLRSISALQHSYPPAVCEREMMQNVVAQLHYQEMRCRHLQSALKHQQRQTEKILQASWEQHKNDLVSVQATLRMTQEKLHQQTRATKDQMERLAKSDVLVKDLFVENGQLLATIQNLEEHCRYLTDKAMLTSSV